MSFNCNATQSELYIFPIIIIMPPPLVVLLRLDGALYCHFIGDTLSLSLFSSHWPANKSPVSEGGSEGVRPLAVTTKNDSQPSCSPLIASAQFCPAIGHRPQPAAAATVDRQKLYTPGTIWCEGKRTETGNWLVCFRDSFSAAAVLSAIWTSSITGLNLQLSFFHLTNCILSFLWHLSLIGQSVTWWLWRKSFLCF